MIDTSWQEQAACAGDTEFTRRPLEDQIAMCDRCPVADACRAYGYDYGCDSEVYGGVRIVRKTPRINPALYTRCDFCRSTFTGPGWQKYCGRTCRQKAYDQRTKFRSAA